MFVNIPLDAVTKSDTNVDGEVPVASGTEEKDSSTAEPDDDIDEEDELEEPSDDENPEEEIPDANVSEDELEVEDDDGNEDSPAADDQGIFRLETHQDLISFISLFSFYIKCREVALQP